MKEYENLFNNFIKIEKDVFLSQGSFILQYETIKNIIGHGLFIYNVADFSNLYYMEDWYGRSYYRYDSIKTILEKFENYDFKWFLFSRALYIKKEYSTD
jgi:hypothetical protein